MKRSAVCLVLVLFALFSCARAESTVCPKCGSKWYQNEYRKPTCGKSGVLSGFCLKCNRIVTKKLSAPPHSYGAWTVTKAPTCLETGSRTRQCKKCGHTQTEALSKAAHDIGAWNVLKEADDFSCGMREAVCSRCGEKVQEEVVPNGTLRRGDSGNAVRALQNALNAMSFPCGTADGAFGGRTESALIAFARENCLAEDGIAWPGVMKLLGMTLADGLPCAFEAKIASCPKSADGFVGSSVEVSVRIENTGCAPLLSEEGETVPAGGSVTLPAQYILTEDDAQKGSLSRALSVSLSAQDGTALAPQPLSVEIPLKKVSASVAAQVLSAPENGEYYQLGETIEIECAFTNDGEVTLKHISLAPDAESGSLAPSKRLQSRFTRTVTEEDVENGTLVFLPQAVFDGGSVSAQEIALPTRQSVAAVLEMRAGSPANGAFFALGERVPYTLRLTNTGTQTLADIRVYDPLCDTKTALTEDARCEAGETIELTFEYTVTEVDAAAGFLVNQAYAAWEDTVIPSNAVSVPTGKYEN